MSNYSQVNFAEIEPTTAEGGFDLRFARKQIDSRDLGISRIHLGPEVRSPVAHRHREQEEAYVVVAGSGRALLDGEALSRARATSSGSRRRRCAPSRPGPRASG